MFCNLGSLTAGSTYDICSSVHLRLPLQGATNHLNRTSSFTLFYFHNLSTAKLLSYNISPGMPIHHLLPRRRKAHILHYRIPLQTSNQARDLYIPSSTLTHSCPWFTSAKVSPCFYFYQKSQQQRTRNVLLSFLRILSRYERKRYARFLGSRSLQT